MPVGSISAFARVLQCVLATNPKTILDLGIGYGVNASGIRNWYSQDVHITGVEGFENYSNPMWDVYNDIVISDIYNYLAQCVAFEIRFDMVIMTDVIEHFDKERGKEVLDMIKYITGKSAVVTTPAKWFEQGAEHGNELETHRSLWDKYDFDDMGFGIVEDGSPDWLGHEMLIAEFIKK